MLRYARGDCHTRPRGRRLSPRGARRGRIASTRRVTLAAEHQPTARYRQRCQRRGFSYFARSTAPLGYGRRGRGGADALAVLVAPISARPRRAVVQTRGHHARRFGFSALQGHVPRSLSYLPTAACAGFRGLAYPLGAGNGYMFSARVDDEASPVSRHGRKAKSPLPGAFDA